MTIFPEVRKLLDENGLDDVLLTGGGIIAKEEVDQLNKLGVGELFGPGTNTQNIIKYIQGWYKTNKAGVPNES